MIFLLNNKIKSTKLGNKYHNLRIMKKWKNYRVENHLHQLAEDKDISTSLNVTKDRVSVEIPASAGMTNFYQFSIFNYQFANASGGQNYWSYFLTGFLTSFQIDKPKFSRSDKIIVT